MPRTVAEWIGKNDNAMPPRTVFDRLWILQDGKDAITGIPFTANDKVVRDHKIPLIDGGRNAEHNLQLITEETHKDKTADEATRRGKERSVRSKARGYVTTDRRSSFQSRGFPPANPRKTATTPPTKRVTRLEKGIPMTPAISEAMVEARTVAALFVDANGPYAGLLGVDVWGEERDARRYAGPYPAVAHPPCQRWGKLWAGQPLWIKRTGERKIKGDDDGCFASALASVRKFGGVLEHPWQSHAWPHFGLNTPPRAGGWIMADFEGGWTCCVEQGRYGHYARKPTMLYAVRVDLPELAWGHSDIRLDPAVVERMGLKRAKRLGEVGSRGGGQNSAPRIHTPEPFRDLLISIARTASTSRLAA